MGTLNRTVAIVKSRSGAQIRLTERQWKHIITARPQLEDFQDEILKTIEDPDEVYAPPPRVRPQLHALKKFRLLRNVGLNENLVVVYREISPREGFIITAFPISDIRRRRIHRLWRRL